MGEKNSSLWLQGVGVVVLAAIGVFGVLTAESVAVGAAVLGFVSGAVLMVADQHIEVPALSAVTPDIEVKWPLMVLVGGLIGVLDPMERIGAVLGASDAQFSSFAFGFIAGMVGLAAVYLGYTRRSRRPEKA